MYMPLAASSEPYIGQFRREAEVALVESLKVACPNSPVAVVGGGGGTKAAVIVAAAAGIVSVYAALPLVAAPLQPLNVNPAAGAAVTCTAAPLMNFPALHPAELLGVWLTAPPLVGDGASVSAKHGAN